jgi:hypothetical protein
VGMELSTLSWPSSNFLERWDEFVLSHEDRTVGHVSAHFALAEAAGARNLSFLVLDNAERVVAAMPLFEKHSHRLRVFRMRTLTSGVEFAAHPLTKSGLPARQQREVLTYVLQHCDMLAARRSCDEIRIGYPAIINGLAAVERFGFYPLREYGYADESGVGWLLDISQHEDTLMGVLDKSCRNMIRRAQKEGCSVRPIRDLAEWMECYRLVTQTMGELSPSEDLHRTCWNRVIAAGLAHTYAIVGPGSDSPSNLVVTVGIGAAQYYWKSYNDRGARIPGANNLALWEAILGAKRSGARLFEMGSMEFDNQKQIAISEFKRSFGGVSVYLLRGGRVSRPLRKAFVDLFATAHKTIRAHRSRRP